MKGGERRRLDGKGAAVPGGALGIGEAIVRRFVAEGASAAFCDRDGERGQRVAAELETAGPKVAFALQSVVRVGLTSLAVSRDSNHIDLFALLFVDGGIIAL